MTQHIEVRIKERFEQLGYKPEVINECLKNISELEQKYPKDNVGFLLRKFDKNMVTDFSNGDELWLIFRDGRAITCFLRRSTQTNNQRRSLEQQLQVDYTIRLNCLDDSGWKEVETPVFHINQTSTIDWDEMREGIREVARRYARSRRERESVFNVPIVSNISEITRLINGRDYSVVSPSEVLQEVGNDREVICRMVSGNYVVVANPAPIRMSYIDDISIGDPLGWITNTNATEIRLNEDNTER